MPADPWTQSVTIGWRPELRFYEERYSLLRAFGDSGDLRAFQVGDDRIGARLFQPVQELSVKQDGLELHTYGPDADLTKAWDALRRVIGRLGVGRFTNARINYQHVVELPDIAFDDAVAGAFERLFTPMGTSDVVFDDWAFNANISVAGPPESAGVTEFGIIRPEEAPSRLARRIGGHVKHARPVSVKWSAEDFKPVSLFADTYLILDSVEPDQGETALDRVHAFWGSAREQVGSLALELACRIVGNNVDNQGGMTG